MQRILTTVLALAIGLTPVAVGGVDDLSPLELPRAAVPSALDGPFPARLRAIAAIRSAQQALAENDLELAHARLREAIVDDPLQPAAWSMLAAVAAAACNRDESLFAAYQASYLAPDEPLPLEQLKEARALQCPEPSSRDPLETAEARLAHAISDPAAWLGLAHDYGARQQLRLEVYALERGLVAGATRELVRPALGAALSALGMTRRAAPWGAGTAAGTGKAVDDPLLLMVDELLAQIPASRSILREELQECAELLVHEQPELSLEAARQQLASWLRIELPGRIRWSRGSLEGSAGWSRRDPPSDPARRSPELLLEREPGDTSLLWYALSPPPADESTLDRSLERVFVELAPRRTGPWERCHAPAAAECVSAPWGFRGTWGEAAVTLSALRRGAGDALLVAVATAGAGGCGATCRHAAAVSAKDLVASLQWSTAQPSDASPTAPWWWQPPRGWRSSDRPDERSEPWMSYRFEPSLRVDLPLGSVVRDAPSPVAEGTQRASLGAIWWRASFVDRDGIRVTVGDPTHWARVESLAGAGAAEPSAPDDDAGARRLAVESLDRALSAAGSGWRGSIARFRGDRWPGDWLIVAVQQGGQAVRLQLPVVEGAESLALLWVALTIRRDTDPVPPPAIETPREAAIRLVGADRPRSAADPREGLLVTPHFELAVPRDFRITAAGDGLPLVLRHADGSQFTLSALAPLLHDESTLRTALTALAGVRLGRLSVELRGRRWIARAEPVPSDPESGRLAWITLAPARGAAGGITIEARCSPTTDRAQWRAATELLVASWRALKEKKTGAAR